jgi:hypothetical protein
LIIGRVIVDRKTNTRRTLDEQQIGMSIPGEGVLMGLELLRSLLKHVRPELLNES